MLDTGLGNRVALVTGGNNPRGIGAATARALAREGVAVFIHYFRTPIPDFARSAEADAPDAPGVALYYALRTRSAQEVVDGIRASGGRAEAWEADLAEPSTIPELYDRAERAFGPVEVLVNNAAAELGPHGITANVVSPGPVKTGWISAELEAKVCQTIPLRRLGQPEDVADAVVFFASEQARWITGQLLYGGGGNRMPQ
jgi:NAD(P)-dependent dehydrogenase (short-subunit alcohol dehydrogenase family)